VRLRTVLLRTTGLLVAVAAFAASGALAWAVADDYASRILVPSGVGLAGGQDLGGLNASEVREVIAEEVVAPLQEPVDIAYQDLTFALDPAEYLSIDVESAVAEAFEPIRDSAINERMWRTITEAPVYHDITPALEVDEEAIRAAVRVMASAIDTAPVDAAITIAFDAVVIQESHPGRSTEVTAAASAIAKAMLAGEKRVDLPVAEVPPAVREADLGRTIVISLGSRRLDLYEGTEVDRTYRVAIGKPGYSTPRGSWEIVQKRYRPTWGNPGSAWAADMPKSIPPGPDNPLGTRALNLNVSGIRIHGTPNVGSIGTAASHGCIRMLRRDVEELYDLVEVGTPVLIVR